MDRTQTIQEYTGEFLSLLGFDGDLTLSVDYDSAADIYLILIKTPHPALVIGYHGEALSALQLLLGQHFHSQFGEWINLSINVNDYRERRESTLNALADSAVTRVLATSQPHSLPPMPASERRLVHMHLADHPQVVTSSEGLGRNRSVIISPKV